MFFVLYPDKSHDLIWLLIRMVHELIKFLVELRFGQLIKSCFLLLTRLFKNVCEVLSKLILGTFPDKEFLCFEKRKSCQLISSSEESIEFYSSTLFKGNIFYLLCCFRTFFHVCQAWKLTIFINHFCPFLAFWQHLFFRSNFRMCALIRDYTRWDMKVLSEYRAVSIYFLVLWLTKLLIPRIKMFSFPAYTKPFRQIRFQKS